MFNGKFLIAVNGEEVCGCSFHDVGTLAKLLEQYAVGKTVRVVVDNGKEGACESATMEDGV
ncbi:MAG: hypothetical protein IJA48_04110 [Oscillospiraceae bacterium]|nr:hypothetical protein [Oscillospiraceae bacterium]